MHGTGDQPFDVRNRVAIVTGGAGLLGREYVRTLHHAGARVVIADVADAGARLAAELDPDGTGRVLAVQTDVSSQASVQAMVAHVRSAFGQIDILVNNAAVDPKFDKAHAGTHSNAFEDYPLALWQQSLDVNITGMFLCAQAVTPAMLAAGRGVIVNVASTYGVVGPDQRLYEAPGGVGPKPVKPVVYSVTKSAAIGLTRYLAAYFAGRNIRVNTLTPGGVFNDHDDGFVKRYSARTILGRMADRTEYNGALLFLVSDASSYMTGANLVVDGGWTAW